MILKLVSYRPAGVPKLKNPFVFINMDHVAYFSANDDGVTKITFTDDHQTHVADTVDDIVAMLGEEVGGPAKVA